MCCIISHAYSYFIQVLMQNQSIYIYEYKYFVSGVAERRPASRRGFHGECCPPTALHRLCGQWNGRLSTVDAGGDSTTYFFDRRKQQVAREVWLMGDNA